jgi:FAD/FMN-containing dehydrogenase
MNTTSSTLTQPPATTPPFDQLAAGLRGRIVLPGDADYDAVRAVFNGMIDRRPAALVRCRDAADVVAAMRFATAHDLTVAVRGGGHNAGGLGLADDALVIDLAEMRGTLVEPERGIVRVEGGCTLHDVDHATVPFGLAVPFGFFSSAGVGGLTLGGGVSPYLGRRYGLTIDSLIEAEVVLADGSLVMASESERPDLFWALRGGGGNFGVVTAFTFRCHPVGEQGTVVGGPVLYDLADTGAVMRWYRDLLPTLPEELGGFLATLVVPATAPFPEELWDRRVCGIVWCWTGAADRAEEVLAPLRTWGSPLMAGLMEMPFTAMQSMFDGLLPPGLQWYWRADFFNDLSDEAIAVHEEYAAKIPTAESTMHLYTMGGAAVRVPADATAFPFRSDGFAGVIVGVDPDPANAELITTWTKEYWAALHALSAGTVYSNFLMEEGEERARAAYGDSYPGLQHVKRRYDPGNVFHVNQNIKPTEELR